MQTEVNKKFNRNKSPKINPIRQTLAAPSRNTIEGNYNQFYDEEKKFETGFSNRPTIKRINS